MFKNKFLWFLLFIGFLGFSQNKKVADTIYVYEDVIVHDTIFIDKPLNKIKFDKIEITPEKNGNKPTLTFFQNDKKTIIPLDSLIVLPKRKPFPKNWGFGAKLIAGFSSNSMFKEFNAKFQMNFGLGVFVKKTLFHPNFAIGTGFETFLSISTFNFDATQNNSSLNGYYFTPDGNPKLFNSLTNKGFQYQIPIQFYWKIKKYTPSIGVFGNISNYKSTFIGSSGSLPLTFDETQTYTAKSLYFGYLVQLDYQLTRKWSVGINYSNSNAKNLIFKNSSNDTFAISKKINQNNFGISLAYQF